MSKAMLVMDMPSCCDECDINGIFCGDVGDNDTCRAGGCPLKELPQKLLKTGEQWVDGYNACIDKILEGSEEDE